MNYNRQNSNERCFSEMAQCISSQQIKQQQMPAQGSSNKIQPSSLLNSEMLQEESFKKRQENKQKFRRLKDRLSALCSTILQQFQIRTNKQYSSQSKSRLLALSIQLQKLTSSQSRDYPLIQLKLREVHKITELKRQNDLMILRQSRFIPAISTLINKIPTIYKNQFLISLKSIQLSLKLLQSFCTLSHNRQYVVSNNMLLILHNCLGVLIQKQERKLANQCLKILTELISGKITADIEQIISLSLQIVCMSQFGKKIKQGMEYGLGESYNEQQFLLRALRYLFLFEMKILQKNKQRPIYSQFQISFHYRQTNESIISSVMRIFEKYSTQYEGQQLPVIVTNIFLYSIKILNVCAHSDIEWFRRVVRLEQNNFGNCLKTVFLYVGEQLNRETFFEIQSLYSQIIQYISIFSCQSLQAKSYFCTSGFISILYNYPIKYITNTNLRAILIPCLCSVMIDNIKNIQLYLSQNSNENIVKYLKAQKKVYECLQKNLQEERKEKNKNRQDQRIFKLERKLSQSSTNSYTTQGTQNSICYNPLPQIEQQKQMRRLLEVVPYQKWDWLIDQMLALEE